MPKRIEKVNEMFKRELAHILHQHFLSVEEGLVTVTQVKTATDLKDATVWVSVLGADADQVIEDLQKKAWEIRSLLKERKLTLRYLPNLHFKVDRTAEKAARIEELLKEVKKEKNS